MASETRLEAEKAELSECGESTSSHSAALRWSVSSSCDGKAVDHSRGSARTVRCLGMCKRGFSVRADRDVKPLFIDCMQHTPM